MLIFLKIGRIKGVKRPAFCPILPTMSNGIVAICDSGANADCDPYYLQQFAIMGSLYLEKTFNISKSLPIDTKKILLSKVKTPHYLKCFCSYPSIIA